MTGLSPEELARVRASVPDLDCKGLCARSCRPAGGIHVLTPELAAIERELGRPIPARPSRVSIAFPVPPLTLTTVDLDVDKKGRCVLLRDGRCTIYESRPMACRVWGTAEVSRCPFGCEPARMLSTDEAGELIARASGASFGHRVEGDPE